MKTLLTIILCSLVLFGCASGTSGKSSSASNEKEFSYITEDGKIEIIQARYMVNTQKGNVAVKIRIRNLTNEDHTNIEINGYGFDKNGDKVGDWSVVCLDVEAGQASWSNAYGGLTDSKEDSFAGIKITSFRYWDYKDNKFSNIYEYEFKNKIIITKEEMSKD